MIALIEMIQWYKYCVRVITMTSWGFKKYSILILYKQNLHTMYSKPITKEMMVDVLSLKNHSNNLLNIGKEFVSLHPNLARLV